MAQLSIAFCKQLAKARREKGVTQSALAEAAGCTQSAISMLEAGQYAKVARETVEKIAALLDVPVEPPPAESRPPLSLPLSEHAHAFCPDALCYSNVPYTVNGNLLFWPRRQPDGSGSRCVVCGELLERHCPHCGAVFASPGACCHSCGGARVTNTLPPGTDCEAWAARRRREIAEWTGLI